MVTTQCHRCFGTGKVNHARGGELIGFSCRECGGSGQLAIPEPRTAPTDAEHAAVRLGARVAHAIAGRTTSKGYLTLCGREISGDDPRTKEADIRDLPLHQHCMSCWG